MIKTNQLTDMGGNPIIDIKNIMTTPDPSEWDGKDISMQEILHIISPNTNHGTFVSAKQYPDGSICGTSTTGHFEIKMNGEITMYQHNRGIGTVAKNAQTVAARKVVLPFSILPNTHAIIPSAIKYGNTYGSVGRCGMESNNHEFWVDLHNPYNSGAKPTNDAGDLIIGFIVKGRWK